MTSPDLALQFYGTMRIKPFTQRKNIKATILARCRNSSALYEHAEHCDMLLIETNSWLKKIAINRNSQQKQRKTEKKSCHKRQ